MIINTSIIYKDGFKERYAKIYKNNSFFRDDLSREGWKYLKNSNFYKFNSQNKIKVLIIGDSHSRDFFNVFIQNKDLFKEYEFKRYGNYIDDTLRFDKYLKEENINEFQNSEVFRQSDIVLISDYFNDNQGDEIFEKLELFIQKIKDKKKIVLTSNTNIYTDKLKFNKYYELSLFDYYLLKNKNTNKFIDENLTKEEIARINNYFFDNISILLIIFC